MPLLGSVMAWRGLKPSSKSPYAQPPPTLANAPSVAIAEHVMLELGVTRIP